MKKIIFTAVIGLMTTTAQAQVAIGKTSVTNGSTILEFDNSSANTKGIILPAVEDLTKVLSTDPTANNGTFLFDRNDDKVKMYEGNTWVSLSDAGSETRITPNTSTENASNQGAIIGSGTSTAKGVLVLEAADKALVLPWIQNPHTAVKSPYPGMMCYDTASKTLAVFDGAVWNYWK